jgi:hypothetical protein
VFELLVGGQPQPAFGRVKEKNNSGSDKNPVRKNHGKALSERDYEAVQGLRAEPTISVTTIYG